MTTKIVIRLSWAVDTFCETFIGQIRRGGECRWQVRDADPTEQTILPGHFDPCLDHLGKRGLVTARRQRV